MRQHLKIDAALVHLLEAQRTEIVKPFFEAACPARGAKAGTAGMLHHLDVLVMLFERDDVRLLRCHFSSTLCFAGSRRRHDAPA